MDILIVDGYNVIGAWKDLRTLRGNDLETARDQLIAKMSEYQAHTGFRVIIVFDAQFVRGVEKKYRQSRVEVIFTKEKETADQRIERMAIELNNRRTQVHVATSDFTEQWVIFGQGALRKSARELLIEMEAIEKNISKKVKKIQEEKPSARIQLSDEVSAVFEKWRRGEK